MILLLTFFILFIEFCNVSHVWCMNFFPASGLSYEKLTNKPASPDTEPLEFYPNILTTLMPFWHLV